MTTQSSILAWRIPWIEEHGRQSIRLQRVRHDWSDSAFGEGPLPGLSTATLYHELAWPRSHVCRDAEGALVSSSSKVTTLTISSKPHLMKPNAPPPNTIAQQVRVST